MNTLINSHAPLKKTYKETKKVSTKTMDYKRNPGIQNSIEKKDSLFKKYIKCDNQSNKKFLHKEYKLPITETKWKKLL